MKNLLFTALCLIFCFFSTTSYSQNAPVVKSDTLGSKTQYAYSGYQFHAKQLIVPSALVLYGVTGLLPNGWSSLNIKLRDKVVDQWNSPFKTFPLDDYLQYVPSLGVYGLNLVGVKGQHEFWDRTIILGTSAVMVTGVVLVLKSATHNMRPDDSAKNSWPSGHTATAFAGAEFMYQEFKEKSVWIGVSGYAMATTVGCLRIYNNKHWLTDVAAGAGFGILSTKAAYWLFPLLKEHVFTCQSKPKNNTSSLLILPNYEANRFGFQLAATF